uniref:16S rRNA (Guanine(966)-N(2))-methyltransferase RsmD n=1 Tax=Haemonchus placei TaxID=6290 RepID=A0A0N4WIH5_HAEPC
LAALRNDQAFERGPTDGLRNEEVPINYRTAEERNPIRFLLKVE